MSIMKFLRYNTRHSLYYHPTYRNRGGVSIFFGWSLNPIGSIYDGKQKSLSEPPWLFKLRQRWFAYAGRQKCGRRGEGWHGQTTEDYPDTWDLGPDGYRTCSWCGSIHPEDLMDICRKTLVDERYGVEGTTKSYKVYVKQPNVVNASEGAIKFYMHHAPENVSSADQELFAKAMQVTHERFMERYNKKLDEIPKADA